MTYTIKKLADLSGVSTRTLRYYDEIKLLVPKRMEGSEYRIYDETHVDRLQQILFYREMGLELFTIKEILDAKSFAQIAALKNHLIELKRKRQRLDLLIKNVTTTIKKEKGTVKMNDQEKFEGFKEELLKANEEKYGEEIRSKYGKLAVEKSNARMMNLSKEEYDHFEILGETIKNKLCQAVMAEANPKGEAGKEVANLHKEWLQISMPQYNADIHKGLAGMYIADDRFTEYYDAETKGCAQFLRDAITMHI